MKQRSGLLVGVLAVLGVAAAGLGSAAMPAPVPAPVTAGVCHAVSGLPDAGCTPGVADPSKTAEIICASGYRTTTVRPPVTYTNALKLKQMAAYGFAGSPSLYEEDHLISLELGGSPTDPMNLWPQAYEPRPGAHEKDVVEGHLHAEVCAGRMSLVDAQQAIAGDWLAVWKGLHP